MSGSYHSLVIQAPNIIMNNTNQSKLIKKFHDAWCLANGYKLSSRRAQGPSPQAKGSSFKPKSTSSRIREPG